MGPFRNSKKYAFYWKLKRDMETSKRFSGQATQNKAGKFGFEQAMQLDTVLEHSNCLEASSFM